MSVLQRLSQTRFSSNSLANRQLIVGIVLFLIASSIFCAIAVQVVNGAPITMLDLHIAQWLHAQATPNMTAGLLLFTHLHGTTAVSCWGMILGAYLAYRRKWYWLFSTVFAVAGGMLLNMALKHAFQRARPHFDEPLLTLSTYSFPSGHTAASTVFYGVLAAYLCTQTSSQGRQLLIVMAAMTMVTLAGLSRMYLGVHYFSDVIAAIAEGCAWLGLTLTIITLLRLNNQVHASQRTTIVQRH